MSKEATKKKLPTLGLCMIVKDEEENIKRALSSVVHYVDEVCITDTGSTDKTIEIIKEVCEQADKPLILTEINPKKNPDFYLDTEWQGKKYKDLDFPKARNYNFETCKSDYIFWMDADDTVVGADGLPEAVRIMDARAITDIGMDYHYEVDERGRPQTIHTKERIVQNGLYQWELDPIWKVHENLYPKPGVDKRNAYEQNIYIRHWATKSDQDTSNIRNIRILTWMLVKMGDKPDPRAVFLLGREYYGIKKYLDAQYNLTHYINMVGNIGDRMLACSMLSDIELALGDYPKALDFAMEGVKSRPDHPSGYLNVARAYLMMGYFDLALQFVDDATKRVITPMDGGTHNPYQLEKLAVFVTSKAMAESGQHEAAIKTLQDFAPQALPEDVDTIREELEELERNMANEKAMTAFTVMSKTILETQRQELEEGDEYDIKPLETLIDLLPKRTHYHPRITNLKRQLGLNRELGYSNPKKDKETKPHIAIYCSMNFEEWDPISVIQNGGGGSETAVVEQAKRFAAAGYEVEVYANPPEEKVVDGVSYRKAENINWADTFDIFISWRNPWILKQVKVYARKKFLWLQDIMNAVDYPHQIVEQLDRIIVLSKYQRDWLPGVPEDKFFYTTNGINLELIEEVEKEMAGEEREKNYCINASSADRGLDGLVSMWGKLPAKLRKGAKLAWYYGWNSWNKLRLDEEGEKFKERMNKEMEEADIVNGGRIGKKELYKEYFKADYWVYPLVGPAETSCITAMEAQACGAYPITTGITALEETQQYGIKIPLGKFPQVLEETLKHGKVRVEMDEEKQEVKRYVLNPEEEQALRQRMMDWARETFNWDRVANQWMDELFYGRQL